MKSPNIAPAYACLYPGLCDRARALGYALGIHGSVVTDLDLIAVPWSDAAVPAHELVAALMEHIGACGYADLLRRDSCLTEEQIGQVMARTVHKDPEQKPHGRLAWNLYLHAGAKVDLSVMPRQLPPPSPTDDSIGS